MILPYVDSDHRYWQPSTKVDVPAREVPGVTAILLKAGLIDTRWVDQYALDRGTAIHDAVLFDHENDLDESSLDPVVVPYLAQYRRFMQMTKARVISAEKIVYSAMHNYAGRYDLIIELNGQIVLVDIKTGKAPKHVNAQVGAYSFALREQGSVIHRVGCLELTPDTFALSTWEPLLAQAEWFRVLAQARAAA